MTAELIVVNGAHAGTRFALDREEFVIGRAPNSAVVLPEPEVSWRHCQIRRQGLKYLVTDLRTSAGSYVNGMRTAERWLEDRDQIGIGKTILMFRSAEGIEADQVSEVRPDTKPVLLAACALVFLFRALAASVGDAQNGLLQNQILRLIRDLIPTREGFLVVGTGKEELRSRFHEQYPKTEPGFEEGLLRVCDEGAFEDAASGTVGVPLYVAGTLSGAIILRVEDPERVRLTSHLDILTAIASLASVGFEANREVESLKAEKALLEERVGSTTGIVGKSQPVLRLLELIERVAPRDTTVLILGESGTGKELIARALHAQSPRHDRPFMAVNCAALSENLFESELFGHEKGAFTGAVAQKKGRFELAQGGTIFLDEVGELAQSLQAKLLRVLQQREFERVGGTVAHALDIRVIAATNRDLIEDVRAGRFREDLYHRLNVVSLFSPPLRERREDISLLAWHFLEMASERCKRQVTGFSEAADALIRQYSWPGNVRELENAMERAVVLGVSDLVLPEDLPESLVESSPKEATAEYHRYVDQAKREVILTAYGRAGGDYKGAAKLLGLHPNYLLRLVRNMDLRDDLGRQQ
jgi:Nif-specific regulatory protein